ncbi:MAG: arginase [Proteobacteria bacterium]|jgi:arginase|nr:arginase [Pseudomonadota bacterium]
MAAKAAVQIIGVPLDLGANMRGANMGPAAIRIADLHQKIHVLGIETFDLGDLSVPVRDTLPSEAAAQRFLPQIAAVCRELEGHVYRALSQDRIAITLGGDHCIAIGSIAGVARYYRERQQNLGLIWVDAHADCNTPASSPSGNIHGMPLSVALGQGHPELLAIGGGVPMVRPENVALIGIRTLDGIEKQILKASGVRYFTMREIDERGMHAVMKDAVAVASKGTGAIHLSFDLDGIDPTAAPGVSTAVTGGISYREAHLALEMIADTGLLSSMDFVELNPMTDITHKTAQLTVELVQSALGKSIV